MFLQIADEQARLNSGFSYFVIGIQKTGNTLSLFHKASELGVDYVLARDVNERNLEQITGRLAGFIERHDGIYLTICSDCFSSAYAPGVSSPQPFGMHPETVLQWVKRVVKSGKTVCFDIAEVSPRFDEDDQTAKLASVFVYAIINTLLYPEEN